MTRFPPKSEKALDPRQDEWPQQLDLAIVTVSIAYTGKSKGNFGQVTNWICDSKRSSLGLYI